MLPQYPKELVGVNLNQAAGPRSAPHGHTVKPSQTVPRSTPCNKHAQHTPRGIVVQRRLVVSQGKGPSVTANPSHSSNKKVHGASTHRRIPSLEPVTTVSSSTLSRASMDSG